MTRIRLFATLILLSSVLMFSHRVDAQISNPENKITSLDPDMIWAQTLDGNHFNEFWNYQLYFDDGMKLHITFSAANFGNLKDPVTGVRLSVFNHGDNTYQLSREYPLPRLVQDKENYRFQLRDDRDLFFEGKLPDSHRVVIKTSKDGVDYHIDLKLNDIEKGFKLGDGMYKIGGEEVGIITHIPYAKASGHVTINGDRKRVNGSAYMDHTWQNRTTTQLMHSGYRFVYHQDSDNWDILYTMLPDDSKSDAMIGHRITREDGEKRYSGVNGIEVVSSKKAFGSTIPRIIDFELENESSVRLSRNEDQERFTVLGELGWVARRAARTFLGGEVIDYRGEAVLMESSKRPKHGEYNFFFVD